MSNSNLNSNLLLTLRSYTLWKTNQRLISSMHFIMYTSDSNIEQGRCSWCVSTSKLSWMNWLLIISLHNLSINYMPKRRMSILNIFLKLWLSKVVGWQRGWFPKGWIRTGSVCYQVGYRLEKNHFFVNSEILGMQILWKKTRKLRQI